MRLLRLPALFLLALVAFAATASAAPRHAPEVPPKSSATSGVADLDRVVSRLAGEEAASGGAYRKLSWLADRIGARLSGTPQADRAVAWALDEFRRDGMAAVRAEKVMVPRWVRGSASASITAPVTQRLALLALGGSVPTPPGGIEAEVIETDQLDALKALGSEARGRIVLFNKATRVDPQGEGYGETSPLRNQGPSVAAAQGAVATLVRSLGTLSARLPHTGALRYKDDAPKIPAAAISAEDAELIHRLLEAGETVRVRLEQSCDTYPDVESANAVAEIRGRSKPEEIVVLGAHLDSWDVGTGAIDDGAGVAIVMEAMRLVHKLDLRPKRTLRAVLYMNEENGGRGGKGYVAAHQEEIARHVAALESDSGGARPLGFNAGAGEGGAETVRALARHLRALGVDTVWANDHGGSDIGPLGDLGCPVLGLRQDSTRYFDWHHSEADTLDKVNPRDLADNAVAMAFMAYALADSAEALPRLPPKPPAAAGR